MFSKFKKGVMVLVVGKGKIEPIKTYKYRYGKVIQRDDFFKDYEIKFKDGTTDWLDEQYLRYSKKYSERSNHK